MTEHNLSKIDVESVLGGVLDDMHEGFQVIGTDWKYLYVNDVVAKQGKRTKEDLIGRTMMECYPGIEHTPAFAIFRQVMATRKSVRFENEFAYPDGSVGWFELIVHAVEQGILILSVDITERKRAQLELADKIKELDILMHSTVDRELRVAKLKEEITNLKALADQHLVTSPLT